VAGLSIAVRAGQKNQDTLNVPNSAFFRSVSNMSVK
jgi:hypothetical protein